MLGHNLFIWNVRGLNMRARRAVIHEFLLQERVSALCLVETKLDVLSTSLATDLMGAGFDYMCLPSMGASGGIVVAWSCDAWEVTTRTYHSHSITIHIAPTSSPSSPWTLSVVYRPVLEDLKLAFLDELREVHAEAMGPLLICGDFNQIYHAIDKNNNRLNLRSMC
jgi:exonuclease III